MKDNQIAKHIFHRIKFKNKICFLSLLAVLSITAVWLFFYYKQDEPIIIDGIENTSLFLINSSSFYLVYPGNANKNSKIVEYDYYGEKLNTFEVIDKDYGYMGLSQNPEDFDTLYLWRTGEPIVVNYFFTYDIKDKKFNKQETDYFDYLVGVEHILHYGDEVYFKTILSHLSGEQEFNGTSLKSSISNYHEEKSFETNYEQLPHYTPIILRDDKIYYSLNTGKNLVYIDEQTGEAHDLPINGYAGIYTSYFAENIIYCINFDGALIALDENMNYSVSYPFAEVVDEQDPFNYIYWNYFSSLMISPNKALHSIYEFTDIYTLGLLTLGPTPEYKVITDSELRKKYRYRMLYTDSEKGWTYLIADARKGTDKGYLLIFDVEKEQIIHKIEIQDARSVNMIIH